MMNDNLARELTDQAQQTPYRQAEPNQKQEKNIRKKLYKKGLTRMELIVSSLLMSILFLMAAGHISLSMQVSTMNRSIQDIKAEASMVQVENTNYEQNVQELSRYDRVYSIAKENNLEMNENQIRNVFE
ncbi:MAG: cell division protein FtsL [Alkalibacterium gilvum]|uniref:Cell division protein FtsL n=1 Tax=Alkalibacterium gilvum TaxID=1130080 RepID=A0A1H6TQF3_9LACT|nr:MULTISPECIES: cell division protein FtsL [Alkalibacterium]MDN6194050.1 cell division protein FtsL [Alkalibacterium sp.]MDN6293129.1 cell division protein FtsL [Alkalibacterium sp.]MDN6295058.1 cell division protein FtsL [Alkalibacterium sp.]MDN6385407.1 cell division protein FtsL [Alkalibacterium sp.]MDN6398458.1 cell division protein FtsL [Alkalibacterium sp.]